MADQTNPWGSAPSTDSASQAADAWVAPLPPRRLMAAAPTGCTAPGAAAGTVQYHGSVP